MRSELHKLSKLLTVWLLLIAAPALAGKTSDGGGSDEPPTAREVRDVLFTLANQEINSEWLSGPIQFYTDTSNQNFSGERDPALFEILAKMGSSLPDHKQILIELKEDGPCQSLDGEQEAAAPLCGAGKPICFSIPLIQKRYPRVTLKESLKPLFAHEIAHEQCADEALAKKVERFFSERTAAKEDEVFDLQYHAMMLAEFLGAVRASLQNRAGFNSSNAGICLNLGRIETYSETLAREISKNIREFSAKEVSKPIQTANIRFHSLPLKANGFCGDDPHHVIPNSINPQDRIALLNLIEKEIDTYNVLREEFKKVTGIILRGIGF